MNPTGGTTIVLRRRYPLSFFRGDPVETSESCVGSLFLVGWLLHVGVINFIVTRLTPTPEAILLLLAFIILGTELIRLTFGAEFHDYLNAAEQADMTTPVPVTSISMSSSSVNPVHEDDPEAIVAVIAWLVPAGTRALAVANLWPGPRPLNATAMINPSEIAPVRFGDIDPAVDVRVAVPVRYGAAWVYPRAL